MDGHGLPKLGKTVKKVTLVLTVTLVTLSVLLGLLLGHSC